MTLKRRYIKREKLPRSFYNPINGNFISDISGRKKLGEGATLEQALDACDTPALYILPMPKGTYLHKASLYPAKADWSTIEGVTVDAWYGENAGIVRMSGKKISINPIGRWFDVPVNAYLSDVKTALDTLEKLLDKHMQPNKKEEDYFPVYLQETPARTSMDLMRRKLPIGAEYDPIPSDIEHILLTCFSQQRNELVPHDYETASDIRLYDGRFMYGSCPRRVPVGESIHDTSDEYLPYIAGFYKVETTVPLHWKHVGLLPFKNPNNHNKQHGSIYPNRPGESFESWCSDKELRLAKEKEWPFTVKERILWPNTQARKSDIGEEAYKLLGQDPLRYWSDGFVHIRQDILPTLTMSDVQKEMISGGLRNLLMHGVGTMHSSKKGLTIPVDSLDDIPDDIPVEDTYENGGYPYYKTTKDLNPWQKDQFQPHWIQYLYCDCKVKTTRFVLDYIPYEQCMAIRTDGVWTLGPCSVPPDNGKVGTFREKPLAYTGPYTYPTTERTLQILMHTAKGD
jgi:hypothetical protein